LAMTRFLALDCFATLAMTRLLSFIFNP
jgi:hypothetical protein